MELRFHGACREVGRAGILLEEKNKRVVLDYGVKVGEEKNVLPLPVQGFLDAAIVTHAHLDHSGALPILYQHSEVVKKQTKHTKVHQNITVQIVER